MGPRKQKPRKTQYIAAFVGTLLGLMFVLLVLTPVVWGSTWPWSFQETDISRRATAMGHIGGFIGGFAGVMSDHVRGYLTLMTLPIPFALGLNPRRAGAMAIMSWAALIEAALATGVEAAAQPGVQHSREMLGLPRCTGYIALLVNPPLAGWRLPDAWPGGVYNLAGDRRNPLI